jgi:hypothetical protein
MFIKHVENRDVAFEVYKIYLEGDHYVVIGAWINTRFQTVTFISEDRIMIEEKLIHNWLLTKTEEYQGLKTCTWYPLRGNI